MCGICGFNWEDKNLIKKCTDILSYRGPDDKGYYTDESVSLGHRRLSIIDLSKKGKQPMSNEDGSVLIVYNGEIYNFKQIKKNLEKKGHRFFSNTDTEVIIHAYEEWAEGCLKLFNGMFAFCIYDKNKHLLFLVRDRIGVKPLYYSFHNGNFIFASEIKSILKTGILKPEINFDSFNRFLMLRYINGEETIFKNIKKLPPSHYMIFDLNKKSVSINRYWELKENINKASEEVYIENLKNLLLDSVSLRLVGDVPLGSYLSGGIDSSVIVGILRKLNHDGEIRTFSVGFEYGDKYNELNYAKYVSEIFDTNHKEFVIGTDSIKLLPQIIWHLDEPISDPAVIPNFLLSKLAKKYVTIVLTGDGGDEMFAGYDQYKFLKLGHKIRAFPLKKAIPKIIKFVPKIYLDRIYKYSTSTGDKIFERFGKFISSIEYDKAKAYLEILSIFDEEERERIINKGIIEKIPDFNYYERFNNDFFNKKFSFLNQILYFDINNVLPESFLIKVDRMTMAHSVEARGPFLDYRIAEFSFGIPSELKLYGFTTKYILKKAAMEYLPDKIIKRKKQTFHIPIDEWIEHDLKEILENLISERGTKHYFNQKEIEKIFRNYKSSPLFFGRQLWSLLNFEIWHRIFIEEENVKKILL